MDVNSSDMEKQNSSIVFTCVDGGYCRMMFNLLAHRRKLGRAKSAKQMYVFLLSGVFAALGGCWGVGCLLKGLSRKIQ